MAGVVVKLTPPDLQIEPGGEATLTVEVTNRTSVVEGFEISVVGPLARWARVDPPVLNLDAGVEPGLGFESTEPTGREAAATGTAQITFRIPRAPDPLAMSYNFGVHVRAVSDSTVARAEEGEIRVAPFVELETEIVPETSRGSFSGDHELSIKNHGNIVADVAARAVQVNRELAFRVAPAQVGIPPGKPRTVRIRARPKDRFLMGPPKQVPFQVKIDEPLAGALTIPGFLEQHPIIPSWVKPLAGLALGGVAAVLLLPPILVAIGVLPSPSPTQTAIESTMPSPTPPPPSPTPGSSPTTPPTEAPSPSPHLYARPDDVTIATNLTDGSGLTLDCDPDDNGCIRNIKDRLRLILVNLQGVADGGDLINFRDTPEGTLPLLAVWTDGVFLFSSPGAPAITGETTQVRVDLAPIIAGLPAYALIHDSVARLDRKLFLPPAEGRALFEEVYDWAPIMEPIPTPAPVPTRGTYTSLRDLTDRDWVFDTQWVAVVP